MGLDGMLPKARADGAQGFTLPIEDVHPNRAQPRSRFDDAKLDELAASIREVGILEPILVRKRAQGGHEIIAGERRWRAAQRAGLKDVPVFVRELGTEQAFEAALIENLQREDLNPIETARAFQRLVDDHKMTQETVASRVGKDRSTIANALRLLKLPDAVLDAIEDGRLSEGHGRALLGAPDASSMRSLAAQAIAKGWSVRETERHVRGLAKGKKDGAPPVKNANLRDLENRLSKSLGARVSVDDKKGKGSVVIRYTSHDELDRILEHLLR